jgi:hypothetical protein
MGLNQGVRRIEVKDEGGRVVAGVDLMTCRMDAGDKAQGRIGSLGAVADTTGDKSPGWHLDNGL